MRDTQIEVVNINESVAIRVARFEPSIETVKATGIIQIIHGFGEGIEHYNGFAKFFSENGFVCVIHDQRGHGKMPDLSPRQREKARGIAPNYESFLEDIKTIREKISEWYPSLPVILFGNSMGGNIVINFLLKNQSGQGKAQYEKYYKKVILEAPWLRLYKPLPAFQVMAARFIGKISRKITVKTNLKVDHILRNQEIIKNLKNDGVFHDRISLRLFTEISDAGEYAIKNAMLINLPTLLLCAGKDKIVCSEAIREFSVNGKENIVLEECVDGYHCLHGDIVNKDVFRVMLDFCSK